MENLILLLINIRRLFMYIVKFSVASSDGELIDYIKTQMGQDFNINVINSKGLLGTEAVDIAIIGEIAAIASVIANTISSFLKRNKGKSVTIENSKGKRIYSGFSVEEIKELESMIAEDVKEIKSEN